MSVLVEPRPRRSPVSQTTLLLEVARAMVQPFTREQLVIAAWREYPEIFGLKGFSHPDSHKVSSALYGAKGLIARKMLTRLADGKFETGGAGCTHRT